MYIPVKSYVFSVSLKDFRQFSSLMAYGKDLTYFREKMMSSTTESTSDTGLHDLLYVQKSHCAISIYNWNQTMVFCSKSEKIMFYVVHSVLVCVTVYDCWMWFVFLVVAIFYIFVGFLCFLVRSKTYGPTIIILWSEPRIA